MSSRSGVPAGLSTLTPCLVVHECERAIAFYARAFGAEEVSRLSAQDGSYVLRAELRVGDAPLLVAEATPQLPPTATNLMLYVSDCEAVYRAALEAGAKTLLPPMDKFDGARSGLVIDPFGQRWTIATQKEVISADELNQRARDAHCESATSD